MIIYEHHSMRSRMDCALILEGQDKNKYKNIPTINEISCKESVTHFTYSKSLTEKSLPSLSSTEEYE
ncbi:hypothetical protein J6590_073740 [Homalodisca vitripennis]|nr:hypothetical protein J6590_073740 [Homalodisca vitripennis]